MSNDLDQGFLNCGSQPDYWCIAKFKFKAEKANTWSPTEHKSSPTGSGQGPIDPASCFSQWSTKYFKEHTSQ